MRFRNFYKLSLKCIISSTVRFFLKSLFMSGICPLAFKDRWAYCILWQRSTGIEATYKQRFLKKKIYIYGMAYGKVLVFLNETMWTVVLIKVWVFQKLIIWSPNQKDDTEIFLLHLINCDTDSFYVHFIFVYFSCFV